MVDREEFREDLLYRINTIHIEIPPLRERKEDIVPLAERFIIRFCKQYDKELMKFSPAAKEKLTCASLVRQYPRIGARNRKGGHH